MIPRNHLQTIRQLVHLLVSIFVDCAMTHAFLYILVELLCEHWSSLYFTGKIITVYADPGKYFLHGAITGHNVDIEVSKGEVLMFTLASIANHPFWIKTVAGTGKENAVSTGISGVGQGKTSGVLIWDTAQISEGTYYYQCEYHAAMVGRIIVKKGMRKSILR